MAVNYLLLHVLTAVDGDVGAGDEDCLIRAEVDDEARDLLRLSQAAERGSEGEFASSTSFGIAMTILVLM